MKKVSIIVPVYNAEMYLEECIESIINQTYSNIEIILIDDGSRDKSGLICDAFSKKSNRTIKVFHIKNNGVSNARNVGIENTTGDYILFVDSDDYIDKEMVSSMVEKMTNEIDLVAVGYYYLYKQKKILGMKEKEQKISSEEMRRKIFLEDSINGYTPNKLFKSEIIIKNNIRFNTGIKICEDTLFCLQYSLYVRNAYILSKPFYYYRMRKTSCTNYKNEKDLSLFEAYTVMEKIDKNLYSYIENKYPYIYFKYKKELKKQGKNVKRVSIAKTLLSKKIKLVDKVKILSFALLPKSTIQILKKIKQKKLRYYE